MIPPKFVNLEKATKTQIIIASVVHGRLFTERLEGYVFENVYGLVALTKAVYDESVA
jgi:hypothetical protein